MDCLEGMKKIPDKSVDMILCDLPYGSTEFKWDMKLSLELLWEEYSRIIKINSVIALNAVQPFTTDLINSNRKWFKYNWVWVKNRPTGHVHAKNMPMKKYEDVVIFSSGVINHKSLTNKRMPYNPQGLFNTKPTIRKLRHSLVVMGKRPSHKNTTSSVSGYPNNILNFDKPIDKHHPTQKPIALFEYLIKTYTKEGQTVLDNCIGSGTTAIACINTKRNYIGFEKDKKYFDIANKRISDNLEQNVKQT